MQDIKHTKKLVSVIIALAIVMTSLIPSIAVLADDPAGGVGSQPKIKIIGSTIKNSDDFFELSVEIDPRIVGFSSLAAVLQYRTDIIVPVAWDEGGTEVPLTGNNWQNIAAVPAVAPAEISGKTALTYKEPGSSTDPGTEPSANPGTEPSTEPVVNPSAEPSTRSASSNIAYLYLSSEAPLPEPVDTTIDTTNTAAPDAGKLNGVVRTITVRFKYVGTGEDEDAVKAAKAASKQYVIDNFAAGNKDVVSLAPDAVAASSPAGQCVVYSADETVKEFYYTPDNSTTTGLKIGTLMTAAPTFELKQDEDTANSGGGGADPADFAPVVFFDWDESTLLGSMVVNSAAAETEINEYFNSFAMTKLPAGQFQLSDMCDYDLTTDADYNAAYNNTTFVTTDADKAKYPLAAKDGYTFGKWIDFDGPEDQYTVYGKAVSATSNLSIVEIPEPSNPSYNKIKDGLVVKAAYIANSKIDPNTVLTTAPQRVYSISNTTEPNARNFSIFNAANYAVRVTATRNNNAAGNPLPVQRARKSAAVAIFKMPGDVQFYSLVNLNNVDEQVVEFAVPATAESATVYFRDIGGVDNWVDGAADRSEGFTIYAEDIKLYANVDYLNQAATEYVSGNGPGQTYYNNAGLTLAANTAPNRKKAINAIKTAQGLKPEGSKFLSQAEMQYAIDNNGALMPSS